MRKKIIITEEEKERIKILYEITNPPDEFEVVGFINPFRETKYLPYAHVNYSKELKDGDFFYGLRDFIYGGSDEKKNNCFFNFNQSIKPNFSDLIGKTVRTGDDEIRKIKKISFVVSGVYGTRSKILLLPLEKLKTPEDILPIQFSIVSEDDKMIENEELKKLVQQKLPTVRAKDLPDCLFELKRIKRKQTDFNP